METFDDETFLLEIYRSIPSSNIAYFGNFFKCRRVERLTRNYLFKKAWINSSSKKDLPPDFYNKKHRIMMEMMRVDDCVNSINGKKIKNSFERTNKYMKRLFGKDYKVKQNGSLYFVPNTTNSNEFNYSGYINNFRRVLKKHSEKIPSYRSNHPECKELIFMVFDESNSYIQVSKKEDLSKLIDDKAKFKNAILHHWYNDSQFVEIIKNCKADYVIWVGFYKTLLIDDKKAKQPLICICDVKNFSAKTIEFNDELMLKVC